MSSPCLPFMKKAECHDCHKLITKGYTLVYKDEGETITIYKCKECYDKSQELFNFRPCEVYSRICGYLRPVKEWNKAKQLEYKNKKNYKLKYEIILSNKSK